MNKEGALVVLVIFLDSIEFPSALTATFTYCALHALRGPSSSDASY